MKHILKKLNITQEEFENKFPTEESFQQSYPDLYSELQSRYKNGGQITEMKSKRPIRKRNIGPYPQYSNPPGMYGLGGTLQNFGAQLLHQPLNLVGAEHAVDGLYNKNDSSYKHFSNFNKVVDPIGKVAGQVAATAVGGPVAGMALGQAQQMGNRALPGKRDFSKDPYNTFDEIGNFTGQAAGIGSMFINPNPVPTFNHGGNVDMSIINAEGIGVNQGYKPRMRKGELVVKNGKIKRNLINLPPHPDSGANPDGDIQAEVGDVIVPKKRSEEYLNSDRGKRKMIEDSLKSQQMERERKAFETLENLGYPMYPMQEEFAGSRGVANAPMAGGGGAVMLGSRAVANRMRKGGGVLSKYCPPSRVKYDGESGPSVVGKLSDYNYDPAMFAQNYMGGQSYTAQQGTQGNYNDLPGANMYAPDPSFANLYPKPWAEAPAGSGVLAPQGQTGQTFNKQAWHDSFNNPQSRTQGTPGQGINPNWGYAAQIPGIASNLANSFAPVSRIKPRHIAPQGPAYISEDTGRPEAQKAYNVGYYNLKNSGQFSRRGQSSMARQLMEENWKRILNIRNQNAGIKNQWNSTKLGADQYNSQMDMQSDILYDQARAKRREYRGTALADLGKLGQSYANDQMYQKYLTSAFGK